MAPGQQNGQGQGGGAGAWAERWDKGEGAMGWGGDFGQGGTRAWVKGGKGLSQGGNTDITQKYF